MLLYIGTRVICSAIGFVQVLALSVFFRISQRTIKLAKGEVDVDDKGHQVRGVQVAKRVEV